MGAAMMSALLNYVAHKPVVVLARPSPLKTSARAGLPSERG